MTGVGCRFRPKIEFLIRLLQFKAAGGGDISGCTEVPGDVSYLNMYGSGKEPWKVFSGDHEIWEFHDVNKKTVKEKYVVTELNKIGKKNVSRTAGAGSWDDQSTAKPVVFGGHEMGHWRTLTYEYWGGDGAEEDKCYYYMNELHLSEHALAEARSWNMGRTLDEVPYYVVCRVLKNEEKYCRNKQGSKKRCTDKSSVKDCPLPKKSRGEEKKASSSSSTAEPQMYDHREYRDNNNAGHVNHYGLDQSVPVFDLNVSADAVEQNHEEHSLDFYSALLHSRDYPVLDNQGNWNPGRSSTTTLPDLNDFEKTANWNQYMSSSAFINLVDD